MSLTAEEIRECTMIALDQPPTWPAEDPESVFRFTIEIDGTSGRPLSFYIQLFHGFSGYVDWGDNTISEYDDMRSGSSVPITIAHTYNISGTYKIKMDGHYNYKEYSYSTVYMTRFTNTPYSLKSIDTKLPKGERLIWDSQERKYIYIEKPPESLTYLFCNCENLVSIPKKLYENCYELNNAYQHFYLCISLTSIPDKLFDPCSKITNFNSCFYYCAAIKSIPVGLFDKCILAEDFRNCFTGCSSLNNIPDFLFSNCVNVTTFAGCFSSCSSLISIPSGLFNDCALVTNFSYIFNACSSLVSVPSGLFDSCPLVTTFLNSFQDCSSLVSVPSRLFSNCSLTTVFTGCFRRCSSLISIPSGLFDSCINADSFYACFENCSSLVYIPYDLFDDCVAVTSFSDCFYFDKEVTSAVPPLWILFPSAPSSMRSGCFRGCTKAANYQDIPAGWR